MEAIRAPGIYSSSDFRAQEGCFRRPTIRFQIPLDVRFPAGQYTVGFPALQPLSITGTFTADGASNITGGSGFFSSQKYVPQGAIDPNSGFRVGGTYRVEDNSCNFTLTGTYSINPDGSGTITLQPVGLCVTGTSVSRRHVQYSLGSQRGCGNNEHDIFYSSRCTSNDFFNLYVRGFHQTVTTSPFGGKRQFGTSPSSFLRARR